MYDKDEKRVFIHFFAMGIMIANNVSCISSAITAMNFCFQIRKFSLAVLITASFMAIYLPLSTKFHHNDTRGTLHYIFVTTGILLFAGLIFIRHDWYTNEVESGIDIEKQDHSETKLVTDTS